MLDLCLAYAKLDANLCSYNRLFMRIMSQPLRMKSYKYEKLSIKFLNLITDKIADCCSFYIYFTARFLRKVRARVKLLFDRILNFYC